MRRRRVAALLVVIVATAAGLGYQSPGSSSSTASSPSTDASPVDIPRSEPGEPAGAVTVSDDELPAVANLDPELRDALRQATNDAADDGVRLVVNSGWRPAEHQERLRREAVAKYGSEAEAARWVATAEQSPHVSGDAVDIGPSAATAWLSAHGAGHGLCQIYANEPWHYELRPAARDLGCPPMYPDPTHDPRMRR